MRLARCFLALAALAAALLGALAAREPDKQPAKGRFGYALIDTADGEQADSLFFFSNEQCALCHERHFREFQGSLHSNSHDEPLYRHFAELAREEAGDEIYTLCSACHAPGGVVTGTIPPAAGAELPEGVKQGVTCDVCHQISALTGEAGRWHEPGNASFTLEPGRVKFGASGEVVENRLHTGQKREFFAKSEFCASCHTVIHPTNGLRIEHTYDDWKKSVYAKHGIQCQDCHMRSVEDAVKVAETLKPVVRKGQSANNGPMRSVYAHYFVGGNANAGRLANGPEHAKMAEARLRSAAKLEVSAPASAAAGGDLRFTVAVQNVGAGHSIPTGVTELRQMWVELQVTDAAGKSLFTSGALDEHGEFAADSTMWFGAIAGDAEGHKTYKPWEMKSFLYARFVPPKGTEREEFHFKLPPGTAGKVTIAARLLYRSAPPHVLTEVMGKDAFAPKITEMATARAEVAVK